LTRGIEDAMKEISRTSGSTLLVIDETAVVAGGSFFSILLASLRAGAKATLFTEFSPNPKCEEAEAAAEIIRRTRADVIVAIGGGSALDVAKVAALAGACTKDEQAGACRGIPMPHVTPLPLIACPTTSGTGSEGTQFAAIYDNGKKRSVDHQGLMPIAVVLDSRLKASMPPSVAAVTGLDALAHCVESRWATGATPAGISSARLGGSTLLDSLPSALRSHAELRLQLGTRKRLMPDMELLSQLSGSTWKNSHNLILGDVDRVSTASYHAGKAIAECKTTAGHAMSYQLTQRYGVPHGLAVSLNLGHVALANWTIANEIRLGNRPLTDCNHPDGPNAVISAVEEACSWMGHGVTPETAPATMMKLLLSLGLPSTLSEANVPACDLLDLAESVDPVRLGNNPIRFSTEDLHTILCTAHGVDSS